MLAIAYIFVVASILLPLIAYFFSKPLCFAILLPLRACADQMVGIKIIHISGVELNPGDLLGMITILLCVLFIVTYYQSIFQRLRLAVSAWLFFFCLSGIC